VAKIGISYYVVKRNGRGFWEPRPHMRAAGFVPTPCGPDGPLAWAIADEMNARWQAVKRGEVPAPALADKDKRLTPEQADDLIPYRKGSTGEGFQKYRKSDIWKTEKAERTREDWMRGWKYIGPVFGHKAPSTVTLDQISALRAKVRDKYGIREAHRMIKIWRALWGVNARNKYCDLHLDPSKGFQNHAADPRLETWLEAEAVALGDRAWALGYHGLAAVIAVAWDSSMSPVDVRSLRASQMATAGQGEYFFTKRGKTKEPVGGLLRARSALRLVDYMDQFGATLSPDAFIFRNRSAAPYSKDTLGDDFRDVRLDLFGPDEKRTLADFRRSGSNEAMAGGVRAESAAHALGNSLDKCEALFRTYCPVNVELLREFGEARAKGAEKIEIEQKALKSRNAPDKKVGTLASGGS
jgi:hypothetical protein